MALHAVQQLGLDEKVVDDPALEEALDVRENRKASLKAVRAKYKLSHAAALAAIEKLDMGDDTAVRVGKYRITRKSVASKVVSFETDPTSRVRIALAKD